MTVRAATNPDAEESAGPLSVATELEAIFGRLPQPPSPPLPDAAARTERPQRQSRAWIGMTSLIVLALMIGAACVAFLARTALAPLPLPRPRAPQSAYPVPKPVQSPPVSQPIAAPPPAVAPPATSERVTAAKTPATFVAEPPRTRRVSLRRGKERTAHGVRGRCRAGATSAWCLRGVVIAADDRLRAAYAAAIRAGVDRNTLEGVRSDWSRLRRRANKEPEALIRGYGLLTQELRAEAQRTGRR